MKYHKYLISEDTKLIDALQRLDSFGEDATLFIVGKDNLLKGSITDGDVRRGLINGRKISDNILMFSNHRPKSINTKTDFKQILKWRQSNIDLLPFVNDENKVIDFVNFKINKSILPVHAVIMAGGEGKRLRPFTKDTPKPLLIVGDKPIIEYNIERLKLFGIKNLTISVNYLGEQLIEYFGDGKSLDLNISYVTESEPLGTIGALSLIEKFSEEYILVMNSDLLTNIDFEKMFIKMLDLNSDIMVGSIPYQSEIPYGVFELKDEAITSVKEKPTFTHYSNAGIYLLRMELLNLLPDSEYFDATNLIEKCISEGKVINHYPIMGYWLDIGNHDDFSKAQREVNSVDFS